MPIQALPQATIRAIGSTSAISDPCSVVKELLDNALDASASSLSIEISQNALDVIQLKDNGHGIPAEDHVSVCKHTFTSKIETLNDLRHVGGTSLGFRGEALASIAEMSGGVTVITRVRSEVVGFKLKYGRNGELLESQRMSHPVGTTVRISNFLKDVPVRRKTILKCAAKMLAKTKKLVQCYAMARPSVRISLKVLRAQNENNNWSYVPPVNATIPNAAINIVGRELSSCCTIKKHASASNLDEDGHTRGSNLYHIVAFLPNSDTDFNKINNAGQFLSVDSRPMSTASGVGREISKLFKSYIRLIPAKDGRTKKLSDPFFCLQINCSRGAYDVNIEPGKDDVIFEDLQLVLSLIDTLLSDHYGSLPVVIKGGFAKNGDKQNKQTRKSHGGTGFELLMAKNSSAQLSNQQSKDIIELGEEPTISSPHETSVDGFQNDVRESLQGSQEEESRFINPWSITRLNAPYRTLPDNYANQERESGKSAVQSSYSTSGPSRPLISETLRATSPVNPQCPASKTDNSSRQRSSTQILSRKAARERDRERYGNGALDTLFQRTTQASLFHSSNSKPNQTEETIPLSQLVEQRFATQSDDNVLQSRQINQENASRIANSTVDDDRASTSSQDDDRPVSSEGNPNITSIDSGRGFPVLEKWAASIKEGFGSRPSFELDKALEFERRKKEANQIYRDRYNNLKPQRSNPIPNSPHRNRYISAKAVLTGDRAVHESDPHISLQQLDPRSYLIHPHGGDNSDKPSRGIPRVRRVPSSKLPMERIPEGCDLHDVGLILPAHMTTISKSLSLAAPYDCFMRFEHDFEALNASGVEDAVPLWNARLNAIIDEQYKPCDESGTLGSQIDISSAVKKHLEQLQCS
ncbi:DNA mismatch repair protein C-terminal [Penicillium macrosclerotiorum]|uniref:DNA mismatch repair protein C-terminal n=1 Tax=Penicillium macrosclerotiorum TaxID=303699 RepID=UPI002546FD93|nr:DNA mismatch repair protein C-terminal [Penicillium macrosclerotiorum]KAJ5698699.1 DNA mismatch repair protein C-terminal [Penicillium macrosclerotiorum]